ncbi:MAG: VCBS repeat-containing protein [Bacteroidia bacterium]|nr:VCBS repeat-containing protein [Bacteroidia bacterium]
MGIINKPFISISIALAAIFGCSAQQQNNSETTYFSDVTATHIPLDEKTHALGVALADVNGDGHLDIVLALEWQPNRLYLNDGTGKFSWAKNTFTDEKHDSEHVKVADFDADGMLDVIFVAEDDQTHEFYLGNGDGIFRDVSNRLLAKSEGNALDIGDVNGDGLPDIVIGNTGDAPANFLWLNNADKPGHFIDYSANGLPQLSDQTQSIKLADLNGNGFLDMIVGNEVPPNRIYFNDGKGKFSEKPGTFTETVPLHTREAITFDANGDGLIDILFANLTSNGGEWERDPRARLFINQGNGVFKDKTETRIPEHKFSTYAANVIDFNRDGHPDIILSAVQIPSFEGMQVQALQNNGKGEFRFVTQEVIPEITVERSWEIAVGDVNGDGIDDLVIGGWDSQVRLLLGK